MNPSPQICTERMLLRRWRPEDAEPFAAINSDPHVCEFLPLLSRDESDALIARIESHFDDHGFGFWAVESKESGALAGLVGLAIPSMQAHFTPCVEIGWRLAPSYWGYGYATEAARAALGFGFNTLLLDEIVAFTVPQNARSRRVMERLGMRHDPADDFDNPRFEAGHPLRRHVLYRIARSSWLR